MCGRFGLTRPERLDLTRFGITALPPLQPRFNIAPGSQILAVREREQRRVGDLLHWGLIPYWAGDSRIGDRMANARADTAFEKPAFRAAMRARRCLIPADLFYEWQAIPGHRQKQPYAVRMKDREPFALGGLWEYWRPREGGDGIVSCTILTTEPNSLLRPIHDRMPVIIAPQRYRSWLDPRTPVPAVQDMVQSFESDVMEAWPIGLRVNKPEEDDEGLLAGLAD
jgi:putative SOS response-associated peptidase YedK